MFKVSGRSRSCQAADKTGGGHWKPETKVFRKLKFLPSIFRILKLIAIVCSPAVRVSNLTRECVQIIMKLEAV